MDSPAGLRVLTSFWLTFGAGNALVIRRPGCLGWLQSPETPPTRCQQPLSPELGQPEASPNMATRPPGSEMSCVNASRHVLCRCSCGDQQQPYDTCTRVSPLPGWKREAAGRGCVCWVSSHTHRNRACPYGLCHNDSPLLLSHQCSHRQYGKRVTSLASDKTSHITRRAQFDPWFIICLKEPGFRQLPRGLDPHHRCI